MRNGCTGNEENLRRSIESAVMTSVKQKRTNSMSDDNFQYGLTFQWDDRLLAQEAFAGEQSSGTSSMDILQTFKARQALLLHNDLMAAGWTLLQPTFWVSRRDQRDRLLLQISTLVRFSAQFKMMHKIHIFGLKSAPFDLLRATDPTVPLDQI